MRDRGAANHAVAGSGDTASAVAHEMRSYLSAARAIR